MHLNPFKVSNASNQDLVMGKKNPSIHFKGFMKVEFKALRRDRSGALNCSHTQSGFIQLTNRHQQTRCDFSFAQTPSWFHWRKTKSSQRSLCL